MAKTTKRKTTTPFHRTLRKAFDKVSFAHYMVEDGALKSAAICLRQAADLFDRAAEQKEFLLKQFGAVTVRLPLESLQLSAPKRGKR